MKKALLFISLVYSTITFSQTYQLIPDSCTFCFYKYSPGWNTWEQGVYGVLPDQDTLVLGNQYKKMTAPSFPGQPFAIRQVGNQLMGVVEDSLNEYLIMDFGASVGDTIFNLFSEGFYYHARVIEKDSIEVNNGNYHHFMNLIGISVYFSGSWLEEAFEITWNERSLCGEYGGVLYNLPSTYYIISAPYAFPEYCTSDPLYTNPNGYFCENCYPQTNSVDEFYDSFELFPNPTTDLLKLSFKESGKKEITILNTFGQLLFTTESSEPEIEMTLQDFVNGIYLVRVKTDHSFIAKRIVKN